MITDKEKKVVKDIDDHLKLLRKDLLQALLHGDSGPVRVESSFNIINNSIGSLDLSTKRTYKKNKNKR